MCVFRRAAVLIGGLLVYAHPAFAQAKKPAAELPLKYTGKPTSPDINAADLMTRLYIFADDSMMGREVGTIYNDKGTAYIEREVRRLGLVPGGDNGTYFQNLPLFTLYADSASTLSTGDKSFAFGSEFLPIGLGERRVTLDGKAVVYGGSIGDSATWASASDMEDKIVVLSPAGLTMQSFRMIRSPSSRFAKAAVVMVSYLDQLPARNRAFFLRSTAYMPDNPAAGVPMALVSNSIASQLFAVPDSLRAGAVGKPLRGTIVLHQAQAPGRNVVAILPGADAQLKGQYVAIGAHNDHIGFNQRPVDHDSIRAFNAVARPQGEDSPRPTSLTPEQGAKLRKMLDSLRALHLARTDSIYNGADDDGSGSMSVLEIAESFATTSARPKRSIVFVWHAGEEKGLWGAEYFTAHPTVPRDSIVAQLNMDMVGRGAASDVTGEDKAGALLYGGPGYLQIVGSRRLSTELGDLIESVNAREKLGFKFDYGMDANGHQQNIYCRSDHYEYARYGIPIAFLTTGGHSDYHQVTDEPQYIDYAHMADVARLVRASATSIANLDHRIVVNQPKPDPKGRCVQ